MSLVRARGCRSLTPYGSPSGRAPHDPSRTTPRRGSARPEAIHQARVATRRLRADLRRSDRSCIRPPSRRIEGELRWVGEPLGSVRDTDVLISRMQKEARRLRVMPEATSAIVTELEHDRARSHEALVDALASERYVALVQTLVGAADSPPLAEGLDGDGRAGPTVRKLVRRSWRHLARAVEQLGSDPADAALHETGSEPSARDTRSSSPSARLMRTPTCWPTSSPIYRMCLVTCKTPSSRRSGLQHWSVTAGSPAEQRSPRASSRAPWATRAQTPAIVGWRHGRLPDARSSGESSASSPRPGYDLERRFKRSGACPTQGPSGPSSELRPATIR